MIDQIETSNRRLFHVGTGPLNHTEPGRTHTRESRLKKLIIPFRMVVDRSETKKEKNNYGKLEEHADLIPSQNGHTGQETKDEPSSNMLSILAPLVSGIQKLRPQIDSVHPRPPHLSQRFTEICVLLENLLNVLKEQSYQEGADDHELEMRSLMLSALSRKIMIERQAIDIPQTISPFTPRSLNPFILHASSLTPSPLTQLKSSKGASTSRAIPAFGSKINTAAQPYSSFIGGAQSSLWTTNVIRLGSFQNSLLFSPSPVAVDRLLHRKRNV